ncbi:unnamed protein product [Brassica rapa subsp. narinosa]
MLLQVAPYVPLTAADFVISASEDFSFDLFGPCTLCWLRSLMQKTGFPPSRQCSIIAFPSLPFFAFLILLNLCFVSTSLASSRKEGNSKEDMREVVKLMFVS